jgi:hypothetical protein
MSAPESVECPKCHSVSYNPSDIANFYCCGIRTHLPILG